MPLEVGLSREDSRVVGPEDSAQRVSTLAPDVYASARMIGFAETVCAELMAERLPAGGQRRHRVQLGQTRARDHPHREVPGEDRRDGEPIHDSLTPER